MVYGDGNAQADQLVNLHRGLSVGSFQYLLQWSQKAYEK